MLPLAPLSGHWAPADVNVQGGCGTFRKLGLAVGGWSLGTIRKALVSYNPDTALALSLYFLLSPSE